MQSSLAMPSAGAKVQVHNACHYTSFHCIEKLPLIINVESPGLTSRATQGETTIVTVRMLETDNTGIGPIGENTADGTVGVTQRPITLPGDTFTYRYVVDRLATYFSHAHYWLQHVVELHGLLVVSVPDHSAAPLPEGPAWDDDARPLVEQIRSVVVAHPDQVVPVPPGPRRELLVGLNTQEEQNRTNDGTIINLDSPTMDPQAPPSVNNAPAVAGGDEADDEPRRVSKMVIPVCSLTVAAALALMLEILFQKPSADAGDVAAAAALYSVAMTFIALGLCISVALVIYSIVAKRSRRPRGTRVLKAAMAMSVTFVFVAFITCAVFMLALPWLFFVGAAATAMALYLVLIWKKDDDGAEGARSGVV